MRTLRVKKSLGVVKVKNCFGNDWDINFFQSPSGEHYVIRPRVKGTAITLVVYKRGKSKEEVESEIQSFVNREKELFLRKVAFGIRKNKVEYALLGEILINPDKEKYNYCIVIGKGETQMRRPLSLRYFENKNIRIALLSKEKEGIRDKLKGTSRETKTERGEIYIFGEGREKIEWLDEFQTVGVAG